MKTVKLSELFDIYQGTQVNKSILSMTPKAGYVKYLRPTNSIKRLISAYISHEKCVEISLKIFNGEFIVFGTNGQGSHSFSYVFDGEFCPNGSVAVLIPKVELTTEEKNVYAYFLTMNRKLFSYGRIPQGDRILNIQIPDRKSIQEWIYSSPKDDIDELREMFNKINSTIKTTNVSAKDVKQISISELFDVYDGQYQVDKDKLSNSVIPGSVAYLRPTNSVNRVLSGYVPVSILEKDKPKIFSGKYIVVGTDGQGSHTHAYLYEGEFIPNPNVSVLIPKKEMTTEQLLFYAYSITMNRKLFSYGRKPKGERLKSIKLPESIPGWTQVFKD